MSEFLDRESSPLKAVEDVKMPQESPIAPWLDEVLAPIDCDRNYRFYLANNELLVICPSKEVSDAIWDQRRELFDRSLCSDLTCWIVVRSGWAIVIDHSTLTPSEDDCINDLIGEMTAIEVLALLEAFFDPFKEIIGLGEDAGLIGSLVKELSLQAHRLPDRPTSAYSVALAGQWMKKLPKEEVAIVLNAVTSVGYQIKMGSVNPKFLAYADATGRSPSEILYMMKMQLQGVKQ